MTKLLAGDQAPEFALPTVSGESLSLEQILAGVEKGLIVYFYPRAMTPGCTKQACDFRDYNKVLTEAGYTVIGISPDPVTRLQKFTEKKELPFPLLSDETKSVMEAWGAYGSKVNYGKLVQGVIRSTVIVNPDGLVREAYYNVRATGHVARICKALGLE